MSICIFTIACGTYTSYVPGFIYTGLLYIPDAHFRVFVDDDTQLEKFKEDFSDYSERFDIIKLPDFDYMQWIKRMNWYCTFHRILIPEEDLKYDYAVFFDADVMFTPKTPLHKKDLKRYDQVMTGYGLTFLQKVRKSSLIEYIRKKTRYPRLICGTHLFKPKEYFKLYGDLINKYRHDLEAISEYGDLEIERGKSNDERFLYHILCNDPEIEKKIMKYMYDVSGGPKGVAGIIKKKYDVDTKPVIKKVASIIKPLFNNGYIHLGEFRNKKKEEKYNWKKTLEPIRESYQELFKDPRFTGIFRIIRNKSYRTAIVNLKETLYY